MELTQSELPYVPSYDYLPNKFQTFGKYELFSTSKYINIKHKAQN